MGQIPNTVADHSGLSDMSKRALYGIEYELLNFTPCISCVFHSKIVFLYKVSKSLGGQTPLGH